MLGYKKLKKGQESIFTNLNRHSGSMSKTFIQFTFLEKAQNKGGICPLKQCFQVRNSIVSLANMGVFRTVNENVTDGDSTVTGYTVWSLISVKQIGMGKVSVTNASPG